MLTHFKNPESSDQEQGQDPSGREEKPDESIIFKDLTKEDLERFQTQGKIIIVKENSEEITIKFLLKDNSRQLLKFTKDPETDKLSI